MANELNDAGYETLRDYIGSNWTYLALLDDAGNEETRIDIPNDSRASWIHDDGDQTLEVEVTVTGADSDITTPVTLAESGSYETDSGGGGAELASDSFASATIANDNDEVVISHQIQLPQV